MKQIIISSIFCCLLNLGFSQSLHIGAGVSLTSNHYVRYSFGGHPRDLAPVPAPIASVGYETNKWRRFSANAIVSHYINRVNFKPYNPEHATTYHVSSIGINVNYYLFMKKNEFYIGGGGSFDIIDIGTVLLRNPPSQDWVNHYIPGLTGTVGFNMKVNDKNYLGLKMNYFWQSREFYFFDFTYVPNPETGLGPDLYDEKIWAKSVNLQLVYSYRF